MSGFDFSQFNDLIKQVESLGADMDQVAERVLDAGSEPAKKAYLDNLPYDTTTPEDKRRHAHAKDRVKVSKTKKSKRGSKYRTIGQEGDEFAYLYVRDKEKPFMEKAERAARAAASEPMRQALLQEIENHIK